MTIFPYGYFPEFPDEELCPDITYCSSNKTADNYSAVNSDNTPSEYEAEYICKYSFKDKGSEKCNQKGVCSLTYTLKAISGANTALASVYENIAAIWDENMNISKPKSTEIAKPILIE